MPFECIKKYLMGSNLNELKLVESAGASVISNDRLCWKKV